MAELGTGAKPESSTAIPYLKSFGRRPGVSCSGIQKARYGAGFTPGT